MTTWICVFCGYQVKGEWPPAACPICGADMEDFIIL
jgi:rubrerythrin